MTNKASLSITHNRMLLDEALAAGKMASVSWIKKDGSVAERVVKKRVMRHYANGESSTQASPTAHIDYYYTCSDISNSDRFVNLNLCTLLSVNGVRV